MWDGSVGRECELGVWAGSVSRRNWESLPFSADFRCLGRDLQPAELGISTFSADFPDLGRDFRTVAAGFSTFSADFRYLGRDFQPAATGISTLFGRFSLFG